MSSPSRVSRKKELPKPGQEWMPTANRKKLLEEPQPPADSPCRRKIIEAPEPKTNLSPSRVKRLKHPWASQHDAYVNTSPIPKPQVRKKQVSPVEHKDTVSRRKHFDPPSPEKAAAPPMHASRKKIDQTSA